MASVSLCALMLTLNALLLRGDKHRCQSILLQTQSSPSVLEPVEEDSNDFEKGLEELRMATKELGNDRTSSRRRSASLQVPTQKMDLLGTASEEAYARSFLANLLQNDTNESWTEMMANANLSNMSVSQAVSSAKDYVANTWDRVWTATFVMLTVQICLGAALTYGGESVFGEWRFVILKLGCLYTTLPLMLYVFYMNGYLQETAHAVLPMAVAGLILLTLLLPFALEIVCELYENAHSLGKEFQNAIKIQKKLADHFQLSVQDMDGDGDVDFYDHVNHFKKTWKDTCGC